MEKSEDSLLYAIKNQPIVNIESFMRGIIKNIQQMFNPIKVYSNPHLNDLLNEYKGYIPYKLIYEEVDFKNYLQDIGFRALEPNQYESMNQVLLYYIKRFSRLLWANPGGVRMINHPKRQNIFQVYFQNFDFTDNCEHFQTLLASQCNIFKLKCNVQQNWAIAYTDEPSKLMSLNNYLWIHPQDQKQIQMKIYSPQCLERRKQFIQKFLSYSQNQEMYQKLKKKRFPCVVTMKSKRLRVDGRIMQVKVEEPIVFDQDSIHKQYISCQKRQDGTYLVDIQEQPKCDYSDDDINDDQILDVDSL